MENITDIKDQTITIDGVVYTRSDILNLESALNKQSIPDDLLCFLREWFDDSLYITVQTSGSTGTPEKMTVEKSRMLASARLTCDFLGLKKGDSALLCMNLKYIGAKMVVVRSLLAGLNLIPTAISGNPLKEADATDFAAMTPMQVFNTLQNETEKEKLENIKHLIIGGGAIDTHLKNILIDFSNAIWSTYGMTETLSHIALRRVNGENASEWYTPFDSVSIGLSEEKTLVIDAPLVTKGTIETNDIAEINECRQFKILGRRDNIINSGGIKIQIEEVEHRLKKAISTEFVITSAKDEKFGEIVVLLVKNENQQVDELYNTCATTLPKYWIPKVVLLVQDIPYTETNKPDRKKAKQVAEKLYLCTPKMKEK